MHEIRAALPLEYVPEAVAIARRVGIERVTVTDVYIYGADARRQLLSVETSTPKARAFVDGFLGSSILSNSDYALTSREVRAIIDDQPTSSITHPMSEPFPDVIQDLWQLSHVTPSYVGRAAAGAILLADGIIQADPVAIVVAALFLPFLAQVLAVSFGLWNRDRELIRQGLRAVAWSTVLALAAGIVTASIEGGTIHFAGFRSPLSNFIISAVIGATAGLSHADDAGRRYLIGVAAAVQLAIFPVWLGAALVLGLPSTGTVISRLLTFFLTLITISGTALLAYALLHFRRGNGWAPPFNARRPRS
jgi:hypothetical protein